MSEESLSNVQRKVEDTSPSDSRGRGTAEEEGSGNETISNQLRSLISDELSAFIVEQEGVDILTEYVCHMMQDGEISEAHIRAELEEFLDDKTDAFASWLTLNIVPQLPKSERQPQTRKWTTTNNNESTTAPVSASGSTAGDRPSSSHFAEVAPDSGSTSPESPKRGRTADTGSSSGGGVVATSSSSRAWCDDGGDGNRYAAGSGGGSSGGSREQSPPSSPHSGTQNDTVINAATAVAATDDDEDINNNIKHRSSSNRRRVNKGSPPPRRSGDKRSGVFQQALKGLSENRHEHQQNKYYSNSRHPEYQSNNHYAHHHNHGPHHSHHGSSSLGNSSKGRRRFEMLMDRDGDVHPHHHFDRFRGHGSSASAGGSPWSVPAGVPEWRRSGDYRYASRSRSREGHHHSGGRRSLCMIPRHGLGDVPHSGGAETLGDMSGPPQQIYHSNSSGGQFGGGAAAAGGQLHNNIPFQHQQAAQQNAGVMNNSSMHHINRDSSMSDHAGGMSDSTVTNNSSYHLAYSPSAPQQQQQQGGTNPQGMSAWGTPPGMSRNYREARPRVMLRGDDHNSTKFQRTTGQYRGQDNMAPGTDHLHAGAPPLGQANYRGDTALRPHNEMMSHGVPRPYPQMPRVAGESSASDTPRVPPQPPAMWTAPGSTTGGGAAGGAGIVPLPPPSPNVAVGVGGTATNLSASGVVPAANVVLAAQHHHHPHNSTAATNSDGTFFWRPPSGAPVQMNNSSSALVMNSNVQGTSIMAQSPIGSTMPQYDTRVYNSGSTNSLPPPPQGQLHPSPHGGYPMDQHFRVMGVADGLGPSQPPYIVGDGVTDVVMGDHHRSIHAVRGEDASSAPPGGFHSAAPTVFDSNWMQRQLQQPQQPSAASLGKRIRKRCSNFPNCRFGDSCRYIHPSEMCKSWPHCQYGVECFYIHPEVDCKFAVNCYNWYCNYKHPSEWSPSFPGANYLGAGGMNSRMVASMLTGAPNKFGTVNRFQVFKNKTLRETEFEESRTSMTDDGAHKQQPLQAPPTTDAAVPEKSEEYSDRINLSKKDDVEVA